MPPPRGGRSILKLTGVSFIEYSGAPPSERAKYGTLRVFKTALQLEVDRRIEGQVNFSNVESTWVIPVNDSSIWGLQITTPEARYVLSGYLRPADDSDPLTAIQEAIARFQAWNDS